MTTLEHGIKIDAPPDDHIGRKIAAGRWYEHDLLEYIRQAVDLRGKRVIDAGACIGTHSLWFSLVCGARLVDAYEPNPRAQQFLLRNIKANNPNSVAFHPCALGATRGRGNIEPVQAGNLGYTKIVPGDEVLIRTIDSTLTSLPVGLIKIDVEDMELEVLLGAHETIKRDRPVIIAEARTKQHARDVEDLLSPLGYSRVGTYNATPTHVYMCNKAERLSPRKATVLITTCDRPRMLQDLITDLERESMRSGLGVELVVVDDGDKKAKPRTNLPVRVLRTGKRSGREGYWKVVNLGMDRARGTLFDAFFMLPDDVRLKEGFFTRAVDLWNDISDPHLISLSLSADGRESKRCWTPHKPEKIGDVWHSQWNDLCFMCTRRFFEVIKRIKPVEIDGFESSGVGRQITKRLHGSGLSMYHVVDSLVTHGDHESRMHKDIRDANPLVAI